MDQENKQEVMVEKRKDLDILRGVRDVAELIDKDNKFLQIFTRAADPNAKSLVEFHSVDEKALAHIADRMPEINRATRVFGKQNSQATGKLMSLNMISKNGLRWTNNSLISRRDILEKRAENDYHSMLACRGDILISLDNTLRGENRRPCCSL